MSHAAFCPLIPESLCTEHDVPAATYVRGNGVTLPASARCCGLSDGLVPSSSTSVLVSPEIYCLLLPEESVCCCIFVVFCGSRDHISNRQTAERNYVISCSFVFQLPLFVFEGASCSLCTSFSLMSRISCVVRQLKYK